MGQRTNALFGVLVNFRRRSHLAIPEVLNHLEDFAPGRKLASAPALVQVHRLHEIDLVGSVVALAGRRVDLPAPLDLTAPLRLTWRPLARFDRARVALRMRFSRRDATAIGTVAAAALAAINDNLTTGRGMPGHDAFTLFFVFVCGLGG